MVVILSVFKASSISLCFNHHISSAFCVESPCVPALPKTLLIALGAHGDNPGKSPHLTVINHTGKASFNTYQVNHRLQGLGRRYPWEPLFSIPQQYKNPHEPMQHGTDPSGWLPALLPHGRGRGIQKGRGPRRGMRSGAIYSPDWNYFSVLAQSFQLNMRPAIGKYLREQSS